MKTHINRILSIFFCSILFISCGKTHQYVVQDDLFDSFYFNKLRYPYSIDEVLQMYHDGVYNKLYCEMDDSMAVEIIMNRAEQGDSSLVYRIEDEGSELDHGVSSWMYVSDGMEYLEFYMFLKKNKEHLHYQTTRNCIELTVPDEQSGYKTYTIPMRDFIKEVNLEYSHRYHNVKLNSYFYDTIDDIENPLTLNDEDLDQWEDIIKNKSLCCFYCGRALSGERQSKRSRQFECMMVEYCGDEVYIIDPKFKYKKYKMYLDNILPPIKDFLKTRRHIKRITFPLFVQK
ncbi:MAG: hypothetical protein KBT33_12685 [Prevotellaceae bacterium]|nr:hypothetical protein [Candidatus Minthosoma equi]